MYGILLTATINLQHKTFLKYEGSRDGIFTWYKFKQDFEYDGNSTLREELLDNLALVPYLGNKPIADYIDQFQNTMAEFHTFSPANWSDNRKKAVIGQYQNSRRHSSSYSNLQRHCIHDI